MKKATVLTVSALLSQAWCDSYNIQIRMQDQLYKDGSAFLVWSAPTQDQWTWAVYRRSPGGAWLTLCLSCHFENTFEVKDLSVDTAYDFKVRGLGRGARDTAYSDSVTITPKYRVGAETMDTGLDFNASSPNRPFRARNRTAYWTQGWLKLSDTVAFLIRNVKGDGVWRPQWGGLILPNSEWEGFEIGWRDGECRDAFLTVTYTLYSRLDSIPDAQVDTVSLHPDCASHVRPLPARAQSLSARGKAGWADVLGRSRREAAPTPRVMLPPVDP